MQSIKTVLTVFGIVVFISLDMFPNFEGLSEIPT